jgi:hypothetical protein
VENVKGCFLWIGILALACIGAYIIDGLWTGLVNGLFYALTSIPWWLYVLAIIGFIVYKSRK